MTAKPRLLFLSLLVIATSCALTGGHSSPPLKQRGKFLVDDSLPLNASTPPLAFQTATVITDNDSAFEEKLRLIRSATKQIDMVYYIFADDYSSSLLSRELVNAAKRGVRVRLLVDYFSSYAHLDYFLMLEQSSGGAGSIEVRFFNRPSDVILKDAVYITSPCSTKTAEVDYKRCAFQKYERIERELRAARAAERLDNPAVPSNYATEASRLFLSGLYGKDQEIMAEALRRGALLERTEKPETASPARKPAENDKSHYQKLVTGATVFWGARSTNEDVIQRTVSQMKVGIAFLFWGSTIRPVYEKMAAYLPIDRPKERERSLREWQYLTQFTHHKLLLVDGQNLVMGGRNVEDSYHMRKNPLVSSYVFSDTDVSVLLQTPSVELARTFERLWDYRVMTATLADVHTHAPNHILAAKAEAAKQCKGAKPETCLEQAFRKNLDPTLRVNRRRQEMIEHALAYEQQYQPAAQPERSETFQIDTQARIYYLENLPFSADERTPPRLYQPKNGAEKSSGKHIHALWLASLRDACLRAADGSPQEVVFHNAYFLPPASLLRTFSRMTDGEWACPNVKISVVTNSPETTDLNIINRAARYPLQAYFAHLGRTRDNKNGAEFSYYEYLHQGTGKDRSSLSLHSKVNIIGDDVYIGSANADVRSYVLDTNNSLLLQNAPQFRTTYLNWLHKRMADSALIEDKTAIFPKTREQLIAEDKEQLPKVLATLLPEGSAAIEPLAGLVLQWLIQAGDLAEKIIRKQKENSAPEREYDAAFKLL